jgi:ammonia channel protein AmtB
VPNVAVEGFGTPPDINPLGQIGGAIVLAALGFVPGYLVSRLLKAGNLLRIPREVELAGLDLSEVPATPYPEGIPVTGNGNGLASANGVPATEEVSA